MWEYVLPLKTTHTRVIWVLISHYMAHIEPPWRGEIRPIPGLSRATLENCLGSYRASNTEILNPTQLAPKCHPPTSSHHQAWVKEGLTGLTQSGWNTAWVKSGLVYGGSDWKRVWLKDGLVLKWFCRKRVWLKDGLWKDMMRELQGRSEEGGADSLKGEVDQPRITIQVSRKIRRFERTNVQFNTI